VACYVYSVTIFRFDVWRTLVSRVAVAERSNKYIRHRLREAGFPSLLEDLLKDIVFGSTTDAEQTRALEGLQKGPLEEVEDGECRVAKVDQKENEHERVQKCVQRQREAAREKTAARTKEANVSPWVERRTP